MALLFSILIGFLLDLFFADSKILPHPVVLIGKAVKILERLLRNIFPGSNTGEVIAGGVMAVIVVSVTGMFTFWAIVYLKSINFWLGFILETFWCYQIFACRGLKNASLRVYKALKKDNIEGARKAVSMIVGRDTSMLDKTGITKAAVETVAENTCDGVIAPLFFTALGGAPLGMMYKAVNTMDSMVGYKNGKYKNFGMIPARLDDAANFIPARMSAILMIVSTWILKLDVKRAFSTWRRDARKHDSPNAGHPEAVCAGALNVRLSGDASYFGNTVAKPPIGDDIRHIENNDIIRVNNILYVTSFLGIFIYSATGIFVYLIEIFK